MMPAQYAGGSAAAEPAPGGFGIRFAARLIDSLIGLVFGFIGGFVGALVVALTRGPRALATGHNILASRHGLLAIASSLLMSTVAVSAYHVTSEWVGGATIGKLVLGLRVRSTALGRCTLGGAVIRTLGYFVDALFFGLVAYLVMQESPRKQRLGDQWGRTVVVRAASLPPDADDLGRIVLGICLGATLWVVIAGSQALIQAAILAGP